MDSETEAEEAAEDCEEATLEADSEATELRLAMALVSVWAETPATRARRAMIDLYCISMVVGKRLLRLLIVVCVC